MEVDVTHDSQQQSAVVGESGKVEVVEYGNRRQQKKVIKHALRQQAKRRRKNTTIASGAVPRIIVKPLPPPPPPPPPPMKTPTMREVLASIPGFSLKPRKRTTKKLSTAAQLEQTKEGCIDLETPDSILVHTSLRPLLNKYTFASLPLLYQHKLLQLLPSVDRQTSPSSDSIRLPSSGLNNEFFARACLEWQERLAEGEFTPENQQKLRTEADKERGRVDPWKLKHFEPIWGDSSRRMVAGTISNSRPPIRTTIKLRPSTSLKKTPPAAAPPPPPPPQAAKRLRTVGAVTRSCTSFKQEEEEETVAVCKAQIPDLLPIKQKVTPQPPESTETSQLSNLPELTIINISDTSKKTQSETIITSFSGARVDKRRRTTEEDEEAATEEVKRQSATPTTDLEIFPVLDVAEEADEEEDEVDASAEVEEDEEEEEGKPQETPLNLDKLEVKVDGRNLIFPDEFMDEDDDDDDDDDEDDEEEEDDEYYKEEEEEEEEEEESTAESPKDEEEEDQEEEELKQVEEMKQETNAVYPLITLPNSLILQQQSPKIEMCEMYETKLESCSTVEEADLLSNLQTTSNHHHFAEEEEEGDEDRFLDAESYVLESGQIGGESKEEEEEEESMCEEVKDVAPVDLHAIFPSVAEDCWDMVDSSTEKLLEVPLHALDAVPVGMVGDAATSDHDVRVIPMQEELEVRLEEGTFPVPADWQYGEVKMESEMVAVATAVAEHAADEEEAKITPFADQHQVKLELEVTLTPEIVSADSLVTSTVGGGAAINSTITPAVSKGITTVIPPTTIVCLPSVVSTAAGSTSVPRPGVAQSSSALPYLQLSTSQPMRAVATHSKAKGGGGGGGKQTSGGRSNRSNKPPPGRVNLERSYQICQAVIQNSPNRDQLKCQLKPLPTYLAAVAQKTNNNNNNNNNKKKFDNNRTQYGNVSSSRGNKTFTPPLPTAGAFNNNNNNNGMKTKIRTFPQQRQPSPPVFVKHVFTSGQGIPVTMAVLPQTQAALTPDQVGADGQSGNVPPQYILVQRAGVEPHIPRSSSAPPQQQIGAPVVNSGTTVTMSGNRGRPASVDTDHPSLDFLGPIGPNPGTQAITRRPRLPTGVVYGDVENHGSMNYTIINDSMEHHHHHQHHHHHHQHHPKKADACPCNLNAMVMCQKCGAFCHDDCISANRLCSTCCIR